MSKLTHYLDKLYLLPSQRSIINKKLKHTQKKTESENPTKEVAYGFCKESGLFDGEKVCKKREAIFDEVYEKYVKRKKKLGKSIPSKEKLLGEI